MGEGEGVEVGDGDGEGDGVAAACCGPEQEKTVATQSMTMIVVRLTAVTQFA